MNQKAISQLAIFHPGRVIIAAALLSPIHAADVTWDTVPSDSAVTGGGGAWDTATNNWTIDAGLNNLLWSNGTDDVAIFGDTGGIVALSEPISTGGLTFTADGYSVNGNTLTLTTTNAVTVDPGLTATVGSAIDGSVGLAKLGTGTLILSGANTFTGGTDVTGVITIQNDSAFGDTVDGTLVNNGSALFFEGNVNIAGEPLSARGGGPSAVGGLRNLSGDNSWTGPITLTNSLRVTVDSGSLTFGDIETQPAGAARTFIVNGGGDVVLNGAISGSGSLTIDNYPGGYQTGTLTLEGNDTLGGTLTVNNGTLSMTGSRTLALAGNIVVGGVDSVGETLTAQVDHTAGSVIETNGLTLIGSSALSAATYNLSGGSLTSNSSNANAIILGTNDGASGTFNLSGTGELIMAGTGTLQIGRSNSSATNTTGIFTQTDGSASLNNLAMGGAGGLNDNTSGTLTITGGTFTVAGTFANFSGGANSTSVITIGGTADVTLPEFPIPDPSSTANVVFDGGILRPAAPSATYMGGLTSAKIEDGGITIDVPTGNDILITQDLLTDDSSLGGGLTKTGVGALALAGTNTYTGPTIISEGILGLDTTGVIDPASAVSVASGATFGGSGTASGTVTSSGSIRPGTLGVGTLTTGTTTLTAGSLDIEVSDADAGKLLSSGPLDVTNIDLNVTELVAGSATSYVIAEGSSITGPFLSENLPAGYSVTFTATQAVLNLVIASNYDTWAIDNNIPGEPAADDFDKDGISNLIEYALGLDPTTSSVPIGTYTGGTLTFTKGAEAKVNLDVSYAIETSTTLGTVASPWTEAVSPDLVEDADTISFTFPGGPAANFARLKVTQVP